MMISVETVIDAPPEVAFDRMTDIANWANAISGIDDVEILTPGPVKVGTKFRETRIMHGRKATEEMQVAELVPPELFVLTAHNHGTKYRAVHRLAREGDATRLTLEFEGRPVSLFAWIFMPLGLLMKGTVRSMLAKDLQDLKASIEAQPARN